MKYWLIAILMVLLVVGCTPKQEESTGHSPPEEQTVPDSTEAVYPLTGEAMDSDYSQRAIAVVLNNHPKARPQSGLEEADIVYEVLAEGGITRLLAIYQSELPERIGPIRSARDYHIDLAAGYNSFFVAHGYSPEALAMLDSGVIDHINGIKYDGQLFLRSSDRVAPHNSYSGESLIREGALQNGVSLDESPKSMPFMDNKDVAGDTVSSFTVSYNDDPSYSSTYQYNSSQNRFIRYNNGEETIDAETNNSIAISNVLVLEADHEIVDQEGRLTVDLISGGRALLFHNAKWKEISWRNVEGRMVPYDNGIPVPMTQGASWIHIIPSSEGFSSLVTINE
ncbi:DUF3048 domain-containing protein [Jeotgalibacillus soli]|uniref:Lipoprotein YerB n=1 Tax=Jeotgalibacillus soli TaxID=889306 RepID=A0A0C2VVZ9_9BACL|nr:DUF3048 domain-containing protein [Jeotgalibacillus soli]KIL48163.1 hypothetical protein KP78_16100 [Jeotgalibacillus soli]